MLCALPPQLQRLMDLADNASADDAFFLEFVDAFLKGLAATGTPKHVLVSIRRNLRLVGAVTQDAGEGAASLETILKQHDVVLGPHLGGLANLFRSLVDEGEVFEGETLDVSGLDERVRDRLVPLERANRELLAADDIAVPADSDIGRIGTCIVLSAISDWLSSGCVADFLGTRPYLQKTRVLLSYRPQLDALSVDFVRSASSLTDLRDFALWYLAHFLCGHTRLDPLQRPLVDTLLSRVSLPALLVFERAFESNRP